MKRRVVTCCALLVALACRHAEHTADGTPVPRKVRVLFLPHVSWAPIMIAEAEGFFKQEGLDVERVTGLRSEEGVAALLTDGIDVMPGPIRAGFLSAVAQGAKARIVAGQGELAADGCTYFGIVLRHGLVPSPATPIRRMRTSQDGVARFIVSRMLEPHHIALSSIETIRLPEAVLVSSIERGTIDAVAVSEPGLTRITKVGTPWMGAQEVVPGFQWGVIAFGERLLEKDREAGIRFMRAYERGVEQYREGKTARNVAIISAATGDSEQLTREACWPSFRAGSDINWESIAQFQRWANTEHLMERTVTRDQVWDASFVSAARTRTSTESP
jgi:ABC-type nitrate/sulfonate/bicarbonate transport system substrate-binding protein